MKKFFNFILCFFIILYLLTPTWAIEDSLYQEAANILKEAKILKENRLDESLKRQDMVVFMSRLYKEEEVAKNYKGKHSFQDVNNKFYDPYIAWAVNKDLIKGYSDHVFGYDDPVRIQEFQTVLLRALGFKEEADNWPKVPDFFSSLELMDKIKAKPKDHIKRGQMAQMTLNALNHTLRGGSSTLAQNLGIITSESLVVEGKHSIDKNTFSFSGKVGDLKELSLVLRLSSQDKVEENIYDIKLSSKGKFNLKIPNLEAGDYEYRFITTNNMTKLESFTINSHNINKIEKF